MLKPPFPHYSQLDQMDCGPTCLKMIAKYYGKDFGIQFLRENCHIDREGVSMLGISTAAEKIGMRTIAVSADMQLLAQEAPLPCIAYWKQNHFIVVYNVHKGKVYVADPATGLVVYKEEEFKKYWCNTKRDGEDEGVVLLLEPSPAFYEQTGSKDTIDFSFLYSYLRPYKHFLWQIFMAISIGSLLSLIFPFLTQSMVDFGILTQDHTFIYTILLAQLMIFVGNTSVQALQNWILLHVSARVNISIISDFFIKLMRLPASFFDSKNQGDILQRIRDHKRIENFLTSSSVNVVFSFLNLLVFGCILAIYSKTIFIIFAIGSTLYVAWIFLFLNRRKQLDYRLFNQLSSNQNTEVELVSGMQEIKVSGCEKQRRWEWEDIQAQIFRISVSGMKLSQYQNLGANFINELKNIIISIVAAHQVIDGEMTLGMMMAVLFVLGQLNHPLWLLITFIQRAQDAKISLERLSEIHTVSEEDATLSHPVPIPAGGDILIRNASFRYGNPHNDWVLENINIEIPFGKTTAIVGASGSGKTSLLKLLLKFYEVETGEIRIADTNINLLNSHAWRLRCGVVMQDGFIFSDTIARNIALGFDHIDIKRLKQAAEIANIHTTIEALPLGYNTKVGAQGIGLSQGQKQRILIARAVYKNPDYIFFDEATSALDANNEREISEKLAVYCKGKTSLVIAHRLSTVKNADQILVLHKGKIAEVGTHQDLTAKKGMYYELVKNQLELGN